jgi:voltage-gated potassium channel
MWELVVAALLLAASNVCLHATGTYVNLNWILRSAQNRPLMGLARAWGLIVRLVVLLMILHSLEVAIWSEFYVWQHCFTDRGTAYYYALVTYTTLGYGDVLLPRPWRLIGGWEAMTGVLMFGWSTASMMSVIHHVQSSRLTKYFAQKDD